jgi:hypothetical protein
MSSVDEAGFHARAYWNADMGAVIIAYEGSSDRNPAYASATADANTALALGIEPGALQYADAFYKAVEALYPAHTIYVTGRGLGGVEAQYVARNNAGVAGGIAFGAPGLPGYDGSDPQDNASNFFNIADTRDVVGRYSSDPGSLFPASLTGHHYGTSVLMGPDVAVDVPTDWQSLVPHFDDAMNWLENYAGSTGLLPMATLEVYSSMYSAAAHGLRYTITSDFLSSADVDVRSGDMGDPSQIVYHVTTGPAHGTLQLGWNSTTTFTQADVNAGQVIYLTQWDPAIDSIALTVTDPYGQRALINLGIATIPSENDVPGPWLETNTTLSVTTGGEAELAGTLATVDYNTVPQSMIYTVLTGPTHGMLFSEGLPVTSFSQADIDRHLVRYRENGDAADNDSFTFTVTRQGGVATDVQTFNIDIVQPTVGEPQEPWVPWAIGEVLDGVVQEGVTLSGAKVQSLVHQFIAGRGAVSSYEADGNTYFYNRAEYDPGGAGALVSGLHSATFVFEGEKQITLIGTAAELPRLFH